MPADSNRQEFFDSVAAIAGHGEPSDLAHTIARMLAAARLWPKERDGVSGFLDEDRELTKAEWLSIIQAVSKRWKPGHGRTENPFERPAERPPAAPGALEQLRRLVLACLPGEGATYSVPPWLLQSTLDLARPRDFFARSLDPDLQDLIVQTVAGTVKTRVFCAYDGAAGIALQLAADGVDVSLDLDTQTLSALCSCLAAAADLRLRVRQGDPMQLARSDIKAAPLLADGYDVSVVVPPWEKRHSPHDDDALQTGLPAPLSIETAGVTLALARGQKAAVCLLPPNFLFRASKADQIFKEQAIRDYGLDTIVGLPRGAFGTASIASALVLFKPGGSSGARSRKSTEVFMIDARGEGERSGLDTDKLKGLADLVRKHENSDISVSVPVEDLAANDFNLSVERYVLQPEVRRMRELAADATAVQLDDIAELYRPQAIASRKGMAAGPQLALAEVGVADIDEAGIVRLPSKQVVVTPNVALQARRARLEEGDVLLVIKGSVGKVGFLREIPDDATWLASQSFAILRLRQHGPLDDPRILFRFLTSSLGQANLQSLRVGTAVPGLQMADVRRLMILLPNREEQGAIAREVEGLFKLQDRIQQLRAELALKQGQLWPKSPDQRDTSPVGNMAGSNRTRTRGT
jgi:type I restriction enzyme M protein